MITVETCVSEKSCTGCGGCENVCPVSAITMTPNDEGFIFPKVDPNKCIKCEKCVKVCPALNVKYENASEPEVYAVRANDEIRKGSSSGGMFTLLAENVLKNGGVVYGAAFDEKMQLRHIPVESPEDLPRLRGSKYVQSDTGSIFRDVKQKLEAGRSALFAGTPCQIAGLNSFLGKKYEGLTTVDVLCHGVPSQFELDKYIAELRRKLKISDNIKVSDIRFRDKKFGWSCEHIAVDFENGQKYKSDISKDVYVKMFFRNLGLRKSCSNCPFANYPRQGDISIGDFWGISKLDKTQNDGKGTSLVLVNSPKGAEQFAASINDTVIYKKMTFDPAKIGNRTHAEYPANKNRDHFLSLLRKHSYDESMTRAENKKYEVGIVSNWYAVNFGGSLTQYALYHTVEDLGYSAIMIERPADAPGKATAKNAERIYKELPYPAYAIAKQYDNKQHMTELNGICEKFLVGSDQLFQYALYCALGKFVTLDWVDDSKIKIAYAASYGHDFVWGDTDDLSEMAYFMQKFDYFSTREKSGVEISKNKFGVDAEFVLDPVFLCDPKHYDALIAKSDRQLEPKYIASYILDPDENKYTVIKAVKERLNIPEEIYSEMVYAPEYVEPLKDLNVVQLTVEERLQGIKNCDFFVTDSFHGTCFAILFKKPFISVLNSKRGGSRFKSLLEMFHLEDRLIENASDIEKRANLFESIDYDAVYNILSSERVRCLEWLKTALADNKLKPKTGYEIMRKLVDSQSREILRLNRENYELKLGLSRICGALGIGFIRAVSFVEYLDGLDKVKEKYIICISVKDTPGVQYKNAFSEPMKRLGLSINLEKQHWHSYLAVIDCGHVVYEKLGDIEEQLSRNIIIDGIDIQVSSSGFRSANTSEIFIDGVDYSVNMRGLNFVVYDKEQHIVIDSVCFDTNVGAATCTRLDIRGKGN